MLVCDKCGAGIMGGAKFCPQCGDPVTEADQSNAVVSASSVASVQIKFGQSASPNFARAKSICEQLPTYEVIGEGKQVEHSVTLPITEVELLINLYDLVGSWKSSQMLINGHAETKKALTYYGVGCFRNRQRAFDPDLFCFGEREYEANIWGCKRLNMPVNEWGGGWLDYGNLDSRGVWHFDKARIQHDLELAIKENELCPILNRQRILETLDGLPETINPKTDKNWKYRTSYEEIRGEYKEVAVGICPVLKKANRYVVGTYQPEWEAQRPQDSLSSGRIGSVQIGSENSTGTARDRVEQSKLEASYAWVWVVVAIIFILYFIIG